MCAFVCMFQKLPSEYCNTACPTVSTGLNCTPQLPYKLWVLKPRGDQKSQEGEVSRQVLGRSDLSVESGVVVMCQSGSPHGWDMMDRSDTVSRLEQWWRYTSKAPCRCDLIQFWVLCFYPLRNEVKLCRLLKPVRADETRSATHYPYQVLSTAGNWPLACPLWVD